MANQDKNMDEVFRRKLQNHEEKPSSLAWEKLESKLPAPESKKRYPFLKVAASIILIAGLGYTSWFMSNDLMLPKEQMAHQNEGDTSSTTIIDQKTLTENPSQKVVEAELVVEEATSVKVDQGSQGKLTADNSKLVIDKPSQKIDKEVKSLDPKIEKLEEIDLPQLDLPQLDLSQSITLAENQKTHEEPSYRVTIKSSGLKEEPIIPAKQGLIDDIEEKVEKIGGLLSKVDQGFAELQDAKNNLFASITTKREKSK
ncbi:hypothetical protein ACFOUP_13445 [Belliella kenyensis]|uniref:Anti-sigma factor n=1 Tax=Belliella kenyensis TaxID=1472724 RepID=A0ABV8EM46_9BACT|nr:hypothetical protein [Belliella kenyensis]MCH7403623.1 hypothetical protein [Belliella kenyensis]MDN3603825.1 hypothetical protein [Belliella kenyensis]